MPPIKKPTQTEYICRVCGSKINRGVNQGVPQPGTCLKSPKSCPSCGATNRIVAGSINECEYCGSPL